MDLQFDWPFSIIVFNPDWATASRPLASGNTKYIDSIVWVLFNVYGKLVGLALNRFSGLVKNIFKRRHYFKHKHILIIVKANIYYFVKKW